MNTLKPLFIVAALGFASVVVYSVLSRPSDSDHQPPHIEGLAVPSTDAPMVQMPGSPSMGSPFGAASPTSAQPPNSRDYSPHAPAVSVAPGFSPYPSSATELSPGAPDFARTDARQAPYVDGATAPPYAEASIYSSDPPRQDPPRDPPACALGGGAGCNTSPSGADAPAWPSPHSAAGLAPPSGTSPAEHAADTPRHPGPAPLDGAPEPGNDGGPSHPHPDIEHAFQRLMDQVHRELEAGRVAEAHLVLSQFYRKPGLTPQQAGKVMELLDQLAGTVIYSRQSLMEPPYVVRPGDTLSSIADQFEVPPELIANINGIRDPRGVQPGQELKVVRGPFHAVVHLADYELTMMLGRRYAGRFPISVGRDQSNLEGTYVISGKGVGPTYHGPDGATFEEHDPQNPLGNLWLGLGERVGQPARLGIHGTNDPQNIGRDAPRGNIGLDQRDIQDVYGILSVGSRVVIQR